MACLQNTLLADPVSKFLPFWHPLIRNELFLISNFRRVLNLVCFLLGNSLASEFYTHIKFRRREITQKKAYDKNELS